MNKRSIFIMNRLSHISKLCEIHPVRFQFVSGYKNPADQLTRPVSFKQLMKSNYFSGPEFLKGGNEPNLSEEDCLSIIVPNPFAVPGDVVPEFSRNSQVTLGTLGGESIEYLVLVDRYSSFHRLV